MDDQETLSVLKQIERWLKVMARATLQQTLQNELQEQKMQLLYDGTGKQSVTDLRRKTGFSVGKISGIWKKWEALGLVVKEGKSYVRTLD